MRTSYAETQIPADGASDVPYPDHKVVARKLGKHISECFIGEVLGAGGVGGSLVNVPFYPAAMLLSENTGPLLQWMFPGSSAQVDINGISGAAAAAAPVITEVGAGDYTVALPTAIAPDGDTVTVVCWGARDDGGSL